MNISDVQKMTTETYHITFDENYSPFSAGSYSRFKALHATLKKTTTSAAEKYSWELRCQSSYDSMTVSGDSPLFKDIEFPPMREAFEKVGWPFPENPHNGEPDWY